MSCRLADKTHDENIVTTTFNFNEQSDSFNEQYNSWRNCKDNKYSNAISPDKKEISYIKGKGFVKNCTDIIEENSLKRCFFLVGVACSFPVFFNIGISHHLHRKFYYPFELLNPLLYDINRIGINIYEAQIIATLNILKYIIPLLILLFYLKLPAKVIFSTGRKNIRKNILVTFSSIFLFLVIKIPHEIIGNKFNLIHNNYFFIEVKPNLMLIIFGIIISSIFIEIIFRGIILQVFRQYGDLFSLIFTTLLSTSVLHSFLDWDISFVINFAAGYALISTGSFFTGLVIRIFLSIGSFLISNNLSNISLKYMLIIFAFALLALIFAINYMRRKKSFYKINNSTTNVPFEAKHFGFFTLYPTLLCVLLVTIYNVSIINIVLLRCS